MELNRKNFAYSNVAVVPIPATTGVTLEVTAGHGVRFPASSFRCMVCPAGTQPTQANAEIIYVGTRTGDVFSDIVRGIGGSTVRSITLGDYIDNCHTIEDLDLMRMVDAAPGAGDGYVGDVRAVRSTGRVYEKTGLATWTLRFVYPTAIDENYVYFVTDLGVTKKVTLAEDP